MLIITNSSNSDNDSSKSEEHKANEQNSDEEYKSMGSVDHNEDLQNDSRQVVDLDKLDVKDKPESKFSQI